MAGLPFEDGANFSHYRVLDWFDVKSGMSHGVESIKTNSNFVKEIKFYVSQRLDGVHPNAFLETRTVFP